MEAIKVSNLSFSYPEAETSALKEVSFHINSGEFVTVCGPSGSGKSTLLRLLKPSLAPHGKTEGDICFLGKDINSLSLREQSQKIGFVQQSPDNQIVTDKVWHELAFGLESLGADNQTIRRRVAETASFFGMEGYFDKSINELSGGQKQLLNLASIMTMQPDVLILDEPASQLDPIASSDFLACLCKINHEIGTTIIITEHRLEEILPVSDRVIVLDRGKVISNDFAQNTGENLKSLNSGGFLSMPAPMRIWYAVNDDSGTDCPITVAQGREWLTDYAKHHSLFKLYPEKQHEYKETAIELKNVWFRYKKDYADIIKDLSLKIYKGEFLTVLGGNGSGKSTMLSLINGLSRPYKGNVELFDNRCVTLPQNPQMLLTGKNVFACLSEMFSGAKISREEQNRKINSVISLCALEALLYRHPFDLSGGEQQRVALAKVLLLQPKVLLLDEPTKGFDEEFKAVFAKIIKSLNASGTTVVMVSHDVEFCAKYSDRCTMLFNGEIIATDTPRRFFASNSFYVTSANRMSRGVINDSVTAEDVIYCCTGQKQDKTPKIRTELFDGNDKLSELIERPKSRNKLSLWKKILGVFSAVLLAFGIAVNVDLFGLEKAIELPLWGNITLIALPVALLMFSLGSLSKRTALSEPINEKLPKRTVVAAAMILFTIPLTIFVGTAYFYDQKFLFISLLVLFECMLPFFLIFEGRKPQARELVIIAVLCAVAVAGRAAFIALPQVKPVVAIVIIAGVAFGGETGFTVGAISMLVSNIYFGQGAWTPWQMFASGIIGFISGILFQKKLLSRNRGALCVYGFIVTILIYGGIMNFSTLVLTRAPINGASLLAYYAQGFPLDIIHAFSTLVILFFAAEPMLEKLDHVKTKYGLICLQ